MDVGAGLYMHDVVVKKVYVRCLIYWWVLVNKLNISAHLSHVVTLHCDVLLMIIPFRMFFLTLIFMAALWNRAGHYIFALWFLSIFLFFLSSPNLSGRTLDVYHTSHTRCSLSANIGCRIETCCMRLAENAGRKNRQKIRHLCTITLRNYGMYRPSEKHLLNSNMSLQYGELRHTRGWDLLAFTSLGHPCKFQLVSRLGSVTARHSSSGRQPNFAALNRGRHLYSAGRPSRLALAHISSLFLFCICSNIRQAS